MTFWILSSLMAIGSAALILWAMLRPRSVARSSADYDIAVYRDQLKDVERDAERAVISPEMAERTRIEISRRILDADRARVASASASAAPGWASGAATVLVAALIVGGSVALYLGLGAPGYRDLPLEQRLANAEQLRISRPDQAAAEADAPPAEVPEFSEDYLALVERLRETIAERGDDLRGLQLLAQNEANLGNYRAAYEAQRRLVEMGGDDASADAWSELAEYYIMAAGGYVSPEAEAALREALSRNPSNGPGRYYVGLMYNQTGRPDLAFRFWRSLLEQSQPDAPWVPAIRAQIEEAAFRAGVRYSLPPAGPAPRGPSNADIDAAQDMSAEDRQAMIEGMVEGLAERLANDGGPPAEWARLVSALGVLGQTERAQAIYEEAQAVFSDAPDALALLQTAAQSAGIDP